MKISVPLLVASALAAAALVACDGDRSGPRPSPAVERHENGAIRLDERALSARVDGDGTRATFVLSPLGDAAVRGTLRARLRSLDAEAAEGPQATRSFVAEGGDAVVVMDLSGLPEEARGAELSAWTIDYRVEVEAQPDLFGRKSVWAAVPHLETQVLAPDAYDVGVRSGLRVIARDASTGRAVSGARVRIGFEHADDEAADAVDWFEGVTDDLGQVAAPVEPGDGEAGDGMLLVEVDAGDTGDAEVRAPVRVGRSRRILLTTDKPLYQPSQTIHLRALALSRGDRSAQAANEVVFEVEDAKGNKVFKHRTATDDFGIAHADFRLAREVNMGRFAVRAVMGEDASEKTVTVDRYTLPRFAIDLALDRAWYRPGDVVVGSVQATYTFGKPVSDGTVLLRASSDDAGLGTFAEVHGRTDETGTWAFEVPLPDVAVGQAAPVVTVEVQVTDTAEHAQTSARTFSLSSGDVQVTVVPESGDLVPGRDNVLYVQTTTPAGTPVAAEVTIDGGDWQRAGATGDDGFGEVVVPVAGGTLAATVVATTDDGGRAEQALNLVAGEPGEALLLRTDRALYQVGETLLVSVAAGAANADRAYVDVVRENQTAWTSVVSLTDGEGALEIDLGDDLTGSLTISAYLLTPSSKVLRDSRVVFVDAADGLHVAVEAEHDVYKPAETAKVTLTVTDRDDAPVAAALGLQVVDEAVFALTEMKPGLAETFFAIEGALQAPRIAVPGWDAHRVVGAAEDDDVRDRAARMVFAASEGVANAIDRNTWREAVTALPGRLQPLLAALLDDFGQELRSMMEMGVLTSENLQAFLETNTGEYDPWGQPYGFELVDGWRVLAHTTGPDELAGTADDLDVDLTELVRPAQHNRGGVDDDVDGDFMGDADGMAGGMGPPAPAPEGEGGVPEEPADPNAGGGEKDGAPSRIRSYFPETLLSQPSIITDGTGTVELDLVLADSITTWRASAMANTVDGRVGSSVGSVRVFQDFFIEPDLPATLTRGDEVSVPVAVFNYLDEPQRIEVELLAADGFSTLGETEQALQMGPGEVRAVSFRLRAEDVGFASVTVWGRGPALEDAVQRRVEIVPDGKEVRTADGGPLDGPVSHVCDIPERVVPGSGRCFVKVYPGLLSQAVEGLDGMLRMPFG